MGYFECAPSSILRKHIPTKGNEFTLEIRVTLSHRFHKGLTAVAYAILP